MNLDWEIEMEEFIDETASYDYIDFDYEFDAVKFYDFNRSETEFENEETQRWFDYAGNYPPSPLAMKFNWRPNISCGEELDNNSSISSDGAIDDDNLGLNDDEAQECRQSMAKKVLLRNLSFMNPTASQLAKKNYCPEVQWEHLLRRSEKWCHERQKKCSRRSSVIGAQAIKRQKLEGGFLRKGGLDSITAIARPRITIPREPFLATAYRAERRRFRTKLESAENTRQDDFTFSFRARPLNRKILKAPSLPILKKSTPQMPDFQVFHLRTLERAIQHASFNATNIPQITSTLQTEVAECRRANSDPVLKEKLEALDRFRIQNKDLNFQTNEKVSKEPPIESFSKLSLVSENAKPEAKDQYIVSKENEPAPLNTETEVLIAKSQRQGGSSYHCGAGQRIHSIGLQFNVNNRSLNMR